MIKIKIVMLNNETDFPFDLLRHISLERRDRIMKYRNIEDKKRSLVSELLIRFVLFEKFNLPFDQPEIHYSSYGKPYISNIKNLQFNISHAGVYVVIAVGKRKVGVDIENIKEMDMSVPKRFFTRRENEYIESFPNSEDKLIAFYTLWTLKESYVKAVGKGLRIPLNSFEFEIKNKILLKDNYQYNFNFISKRINNYILSACFQENEIDNIYSYLGELELYRYVRGLFQK